MRTQTHRFLPSMKAGVSWNHCLLSITKEKARIQRTFFFYLTLHTRKGKANGPKPAAAAPTAKVSGPVALGAIFPDRKSHLIFM